MRKRAAFLALILSLLTMAAFAQKKEGSVKGFVYDSKTGEPLSYTNVQIMNSANGAQTDLNGYFSLTLAPGTYTLMVTTLGYDSFVTTVNITPDAVISKKIVLSQKGTELKSVDISGKHAEKTTHINIGVTKITPQEIKKLPSAGGEPDLAQYLQVVPGVVFTGDQGGQLYIRGGSPTQTGIYLDGVTIYNPFHSIGLFSVFEVEAVRNVDVYTAGFDAVYGNRTSAIVDVHTKDGNKNNLDGIVSVSPIMSRIMLEGPLLKAKDNGAGISFLVTGKSSYLDQTSKSLYGGLGETFKKGLPYKFTDFYGKVTFSGDNGSKLNIFGFNFDDHATLTTDTAQGDYHWQATGIGANFVVSPGNSSALIDGKFAYSNYNISLGQIGIPTDTIPSASQINGFEAAINFTYYLPNYSQIKYGMEVSGLHTSLNYYSAAGVNTTEDRQSTMAAAYFLYRQVFNGRFILEPSVRVQYYSELSKLSPEPRIGVKYNITDNIRIKGSAGMYSQNIVSTKSDRDIVNLFTGFLLSPDQQIKDANGQVANSNLQTAYHLVGGVEWDINRVELNLEPWFKRFGQIDELNRDKQPNLAGQADFVAASGNAYGVDLSAKYSKARWYLWGAAGYQDVAYTAIGPDGNKQTYPPPFDTRFNANAVISYTAGKTKSWELSARYNIHSPFPFTQTQGVYEQLMISALNTQYLNQNGNMAVLYANEINGGRLSWYHRLDLSAKKRFALKNKTNLDVTGAITNVYDRNNIFYVNRITNERVYQLPLFPSVNVTWNF